MLTNILLTVISTSPLISALVWIIIFGVVFYLLWWLLSVVALPAPFDKVARVILALVAVVVLINFLMGVLGNPF